MGSPTGDVSRFCCAQDAGEPTAYEHALSELRAGRKRSHWIWFVLPQLRALGRSPMAQRYGLADLTEARLYLADPVLRHRLETVITVIAAQLNEPGQSLERLMGGELDAAKTISSLTLFDAAGLACASALLDRLGRRCPLTLAALAASERPRAAPPATPAPDRCG